MIILLPYISVVYKAILHLFSIKKILFALYSNGTGGSSYNTWFFKKFEVKDETRKKNNTLQHLLWGSDNY